jgi:hypothetical protein
LAERLALSRRESQVRLDRQQVGDLSESTPPKHLTVGGKPSALIIGEPRPAAVQLLTEYPILLFEIVDAASGGPCRRRLGAGTAAAGHSSGGILPVSVKIVVA